MTNISSLNLKNKKEYLNSLKDELILYRNKLSFDSNITFGIEIEYENLLKEYVDAYLNDLKYYDKSLKDWKSKMEIDIATYDISGNVKNGEVNSSILKNDYKNWSNIKNVLLMLKNNGSYVSNISAGHIHIGSQILGNNIKCWQKFLILWMIYEDEIIKFSSGEFNKVRIKQKYYAEEIKYILKDSINIINNTDFSNVPDYINNVKNYIYNKHGINIYDKKYSLYLKNIGNCKYKKGNSIEFRTPNATLDEAIWQNNINFFVNFMLACKNEIDFESIINDDSNDKILKLADLIFENDIDKNYFLIQILKSNKIYNKKLNYYSYNK